MILARGRFRFRSSVAPGPSYFAVGRLALCLSLCSRGQSPRVKQVTGRAAVAGITLVYGFRGEKLSRDLRVLHSLSNCNWDDDGEGVALTLVATLTQDGR